MTDGIWQGGASGGSVSGSRLSLEREKIPGGAYGAVAQLGERRFCKPEVVGSIPISSTFDSELVISE